MAKNNGKGKGKGKGNGKNTVVVVGPYDRDYLNDREVARETRRRTQESAVSPEEIKRQYDREQTGATALGETFEQMLARQAARNTAAQNAIQTASGGAGSALVTGAVTGAQQEQSAVPLFAAGETARSLRDVSSRRSKAEKDRADTYRKNLAIFGEQVRNEEREKQAARIEREAAIKAYDIDRRELEQKASNEAFDRSYKNAQYNLAVQREQRLANADTGNIDDLVGTLDDIAKEASVRKGGGGWQGDISYIDPETGERETLPVTNVNFDPKGKSLQQRQAYWRNYVAKAIGANPADIGSVGTGALSRGEGKAPAGDVARQLIDAVMAQGYSRQDAVRAVLRTVWGGANARAVQAAARG